MVGDPEILVTPMDSPARPLTGEPSEPSGLGRCIMVDAPSAFAGTWAVLRGVLNEVTTGKMLGLSLGRSWEDHGMIMGRSWEDGNLFLEVMSLVKWKPGIDLVFQILKFLCQPSRDDLDDLDDLNPFATEGSSRGSAPVIEPRERCDWEGAVKIA